MRILSIAIYYLVGINVLSGHEMLKLGHEMLKY